MFKGNLERPLIVSWHCPFLSQRISCLKFFWTSKLSDKLVMNYLLCATQNKKPATPAPKQNGVVEQCNSRETTSTPTNLEVKGKENKEQNHCQDDSDEHTDGSDKRKKVVKQKWVPLEIDLAKSRGKRERSPRYHGPREKNGESKCTNWTKFNFFTLYKMFIKSTTFE